eukprot:15461349-Alexandrium_andersonii.AAC.1
MRSRPDHAVNKLPATLIPPSHWRLPEAALPGGFPRRDPRPPRLLRREEAGERRAAGLVATGGR